MTNGIKGWVIRGEQVGFPDPLYFDGCWLESTDPSDAAIFQCEHAIEARWEALRKQYTAPTWTVEIIPWRPDL